MARSFAIKDRVDPIPVPDRHWGEAIIACLLIAFTFPLMAIVTLAIKSTGAGSVFERQEYIGLDGRNLLLVRFRTAAQPDGFGPSHATRLGQLLRFTRIDELPQLINVVGGHIRLADFR
jgi:lipopolysaccharide/colanic/teichoic acid biosynthesis glycosyltransferase